MAASKLSALPPSDFGRFAEATLVVLLARLGLRMASLERLEALSVALAAAARDRDPSETREFRSLDSLVWAVDAASNRVGGQCLARAIALRWMLARRGILADLCLGAATGSARFPGHAWVEVNGVPLGADGRTSPGGASPRFELLFRLGSAS